MRIRRTFYGLVAVFGMLLPLSVGCEDDPCSKACKTSCEIAGGVCTDESENDDGSTHCECSTKN